LPYGHPTFLLSPAAPVTCQSAHLGTRCSFCRHTCAGINGFRACCALNYGNWLNSKSAISFLRQPTTWHCSHLLLSAERAAIDRYLVTAGPTAANPPQRDGRTGADPENKLGGQFRESPTGVQGRSPGRGSGELFAVEGLFRCHLWHLGGHGPLAPP